MTRVRFNITMSADGYVAGPRQSLKEPLGVGGEQLHDWMVVTRYFHEMGKREGGTTGPDNDIAAELFQNVGAVIMGRNMFGGGKGAWKKKNPWTGWWGKNPPYHSDVFVLTHHARAPQVMEGGTTFHFVTSGIRSALTRARKSANGKDVLVMGGASIANQYLKARLIDEMDIHVVPLLLGDGARLFENTGGHQASYECVRVIASPAVMHLRYRRKG
jgi:dihydrofolate reductase